MLVLVKQNVEKFLLAVLLLMLGVSSVFAMVTIEKDWGGFNIVDTGTSITTLEIPKIENWPLLLDEGSGVFSATDYVYCRNFECSRLVSLSQVKCPECNAAVQQHIPKTNDINKNDIPDDLELSWGGDLKDSKILYKDADGDGFRNIDEYRLNESALSASSHPPLIMQAKFVGVEYRYFPFIIENIETLRAENGVVKHYVTGTHNQKGGFYRGVGEKVGQWKIMRIVFQEKGSFVEFDDNGQKLTFKLKKKLLRPGWPRYRVLHSEKTFLVPVEGQFSLVDTQGGVEEYQLVAFDKKQKSLVIRSESVK
jgi:hypothetical protein